MDDILLNAWLLWSAWTSNASWWSGTESGMFIFNWFSLDNWTTRRVINSNHDDLWDVAFETYDYPRADWWNALSKYYRKKTITITLSMVAPTRDWLEILIDDLKFNTSKTQWYLDIIIAWVVRRRTATLTSLQFWRQSFNVNRVWNVVLTFECVNPLSYSLSNITKTFKEISGDYALEIVYEWKVIVYPTIYLIIRSQTNLNTFNIDVNWYLFSINHEINDWEFLVIDGETKLVKLNWTNLVYEWPFPAFEPWLNHIEITTNIWASVSYDLIFIYKNLFL